MNQVTNRNLTKTNKSGEKKANSLLNRLFAFCGSGIRSESEGRKKIKLLTSDQSKLKRKSPTSQRSIPHNSLPIEEDLKYSTKQKTHEKVNEEDLVRFLTESRLVLSDSAYLDLFLENLSSSRGYSYLKLYSLLTKKVTDTKLVSSKIKEYLKQHEDQEIQKTINKNIRKLTSLSKEARLKFLCGKGFSYEKSKKSLDKNNL